MRFSECCGARIDLTDICSECREHCDDRKDDSHYDKDKDGDRRTPNIQRSMTCHYPDYDKTNKEYIEPQQRSKE